MDLEKQNDKAMAKIARYRKAIEELKKYIPWLEEEQGKTHKVPIGLFYEESVKQMQESDWQFNRKVAEFIDEFSESPFMDYVYSDTLEELFSYDLTLDEALKIATLKETKAIFTMLVRADHFCDGAAASSVEDGSFLKVLLRLSELVDEAEHPEMKKDTPEGADRFAGLKKINRKDITIPPEDKTLDITEYTSRFSFGDALRLIDNTYIAGAHHIDADSDEYEKHFFSGELSLILEPENKYDKKAIRIEDSTGFKLGYLPRALNDIPFRLLYGGYRVYAHVICKSESAKGVDYRICVLMDNMRDDRLKNANDIQRDDDPDKGRK